VVNPSIELTKSVEPNVVLLDPGTPITPEPVTYTFEAENTGDDVLNRPGATTGGPGPTEPGWVVDGRCESDATFVGGDTNGNELLDPGETWEFTCDGEVTGKTVNIAEITGQPSDAQGQPLPVGPVFDLAAALVQVLQPDIELTKIPLRGVVLDEDVVPIAGPDTPDVRPAQYLYQVTNPGNVPLSLTPNPPVDDKCGPLDFVDGDTNGDELLGPDEVWGYECETTLDREDDSNSPPVTGDESGLVRNTVTVVGVPFFEGALVPAKQVTDTDTALVQVIEPGIEITKRASAAVVTGGTAVTYTFRVRNTGDVGLTQVAPQDDKCAPLELVRGDNGNDILEGANTANPETWIYECTRIIGMPEPPATTDVNQVSVTGLDPLGNTYGDTASAEVRVIEPAIDLTKTVSESLVPAGTTVSYEFLVTNAGTSPIPADDVLADTALLDLSAPNIPACDSPTLIAKEGGNQDQFLDRVPAETWRYGCDAPITEPTTNVAFVRAFGGTQFGLRLRVLDLDAAFVQPFHPGIEVEKSAEPKTLLGPGEVTYTYRVRNTGDVPLAGVKEGITDDTCSPVTYVRGDTDGDNLLDTPTSIFEDSADEVWIFTCTTTLDETTTNTVVVPGTPVDPGGDPLCGPDAPDALRVDEPCDTSDRDRAKVRVIDPAAINVTKATTSDTSTTFPFSLGGVGFRLGDGETRAFADLMPGRYKLTEAATQDWRLDDLVCEDSSGDTVVSVDGSEAMIELAEGETVSCTFTNEFTGQVGPVEPPGPQEPPDTGGLPGTGAPPWVEWLLALGVLLVLAGGVLIARNHPRRSRSLS
jgi:archaellum component FlaG (FlaF/FlaG flagellin family)